MQPVTIPATVTAARTSIRSQPAPRRFYVGLTLFMVAVMVVGFWPSYFGRLLRGDVARPLVIQIHGLVFVGWMALLFAQVMLAARGGTRLHRKLGRFGIAYGCLVLATGLAAGFAAPVMHLAAGEWMKDRAAGFLLIILGDMTLFGVFFGAAVAYRRQPEVHKRLMITATVALLFAAVGRMAFITSYAVYELVWLSPMFVGMGHDWITRRRIHPVYIVGTAALFFGSLRVLLVESDAWLAIGRPLLDALM